MQLKKFLPIILSVAVVTGIFIGTKINHPTTTTRFFPDQRFSEIDKLNEILNFIEDSYVDSVDKTSLVEGTISEMLENLDPHSYYISKEDYSAVNEPLEGNFEGIGVEFRIINDTIIVISPLDGGPSKRAGILPGDRIIAVNDSVIAGTGIDNAGVMSLLKGPKGSQVRVTVYRKYSNEEISFQLTRNRIPIKSIEAAFMINDSIGYVKISRFAKQTYDEFMEAVNNQLSDKLEKLILDLRNNGGGVLSEATKIADEFLETDQLIVYTEGKARNKKNYYATSRGSLVHVEVVILINQSSASASEILAGALQDNDRGTIMGRRSFGKGLVQEQIEWPDGSALRLTVARYYTPTGRSIQKPYENVEQYHLETYNRLENGELNSEDSIKVNDSLMFVTPGGKTVYGGGGIVPDIFIPLDSLLLNSYYSQMVQNGLLNQFTFEYVDGNRNKLNFKDPSDFKSKFNAGNDVLDQFIAYAQKESGKINLIEIGKSKHLILTGLKSGISRYLYGDQGYYEIRNEADNDIQLAIQYLSGKKKGS